MKTLTRTGVGVAFAAIALTVLVAPAEADSTRSYSVKYETTTGTYARTRHVIRHLSLSGAGTGATVRIVCGTSSVTGGNRQALQNLWWIIQNGTPLVNGRWMEMSAEYICGSNGVYSRRVRYEYYYDSAGSIRYYTNFTDTNTHTYEIFHNSADGAERVSWFYDGTRVSSLIYASHTHATYVQDGLETNEPNSNLFVGRHQYDSLSYSINDSDSAYVLATADSTHYDAGVTWYEAVSGSNHYGCETRQNTC